MFKKAEKVKERKTKGPSNKSLKAAGMKLLKQEIARVTGQEVSAIMCSSQSFVRDENDQKMLGPDGIPLRKPCANRAMLGGTVCRAHGGAAPQVKEAAKKRLEELLMPAVKRLEWLSNQNKHLPTAEKATSRILDENLGTIRGKGDGRTDGKPVINIGIAFGGVPNSGLQITDAKVIDVETED